VQVSVLSSDRDDNGDFRSNHENETSSKRHKHDTCMKAKHSDVTCKKSSWGETIFKTCTNRVPIPVRILSLLYVLIFP
jgi:hypothetical protein